MFIYNSLNKVEADWREKFLVRKHTIAGKILVLGFIVCLLRI